MTRRSGASVESLLDEPESDDGFLAEPALRRAGARDERRGTRDRGARSAAITSRRCSAPAAWARCTGLTTRSSGATSRSRSCPGRSRVSPDRLARFEREARMLASLNHPNICGIYGFEEADGIRFLILELVEGDTLADTIADVGSQGRRGTAARSGAGYRAANRRRPRSGARQGDHPPRPEAREHQDHARTAS